MTTRAQQTLWNSERKTLEDSIESTAQSRNAYSANYEQLGLFGGVEKVAGKGKPKGYAAAPGSGPAGETCGTCRHSYTRGTGSGKRFRKCDLVKATCGPGTDIVLKTKRESLVEAYKKSQEKKS